MFSPPQPPASFSAAAVSRTLIRFLLDQPFRTKTCIIFLLDGQVRVTLVPPKNHGKRSYLSFDLWRTSWNLNRVGQEHLLNRYRLYLKEYLRTPAFGKKEGKSGFGSTFLHLECMPDHVESWMNMIISALSKPALLQFCTDDERSRKDYEQAKQPDQSLWGTIYGS